MRRAGPMIGAIPGAMAVFLAALGGPPLPDDPAPTPGGVAVVVQGVVTYDGPLPEPVPVAEAGTVRPLVEVEPKGKGLKDAVVWLDGVPATERRALGDPAVIDQQNFAFTPHVLAVEAGREVEFRNGDVANHGVTASSPEPKNRFNVVTPPGGRYGRRFAASKSPVAIGCPVHPAMAAWVFVFDHPYFAVTDDAGRFRLPPVPPGRYVLHVRHPDGGMSRRRELVVRPGEPERVRVEFHAADLKREGAAAKSATR